MRKQLLFWFILCLSCSEDIPIPDAANLNPKLVDQFHFIDTFSVTRMPLLDQVRIEGELNEKGTCFDEIGLFYSTENDEIFNPDYSFQELANEIDFIERITIPSNEVQDSFNYVLKNLEVNKTYFFRTYVVFRDDCSDKNLVRFSLSDPIIQPSVTLTNGWYKEEWSGDLWERKGAFAVVDEKSTTCIIGTGCAFPSHCDSLIEGYPFLEVKIIDGQPSIISKNRCPDDYDDEKLTRIYNRMDPVAFQINDSIYFGTGDINNAQPEGINIVLNDFYVYNPKACPINARRLEVPENFKARTKAIAFSSGGYGYVGLGRKSASNSTVGVDFWRYDPKTTKWDSLDLSNNENLSGLPRYGAVVFPTGDGSFIIGGGRNERAKFTSDLWLFTPSKSDLTAEVKPIVTLTKNNRNVRFEEGIGFLIKNELYVGLGNNNKDFFKLENDNWVLQDPFPGVSVSNPVSFVLGEKGYMFTGAKNDNRDVSLSRDLWIYVPE